MASPAFFLLVQKQIQDRGLGWSHSG
jgi:hypothetical protein